MNQTGQSSTHSKVRVHPGTINLFTEATWNFSKSILWPLERFSKAEENLSKYFIREYYEAISEEKFTQIAAKRFSAYCQRVLLARDYVNRYPDRYIPHPCVWLDKRNPKGFAGTKKWYKQNQLKRKSLKEAISQEVPVVFFYSFSA